MKALFIQFLFVLGVLLCFSSLGDSLHQVVLKEGTEDYYLSREQLEIAEDSTGKWTIDSIVTTRIHSFQLNHEDYRYAENPNSVYWIHLRIQALEAVSKKWVFEALSLHTHDLRIYYKNASGMFEEHISGEQLPFGRREYKVKNITFDLPIRDGGLYDVFVRVKSSNEAGFEYKIRSQQYFTWYTTHEYMYLGIYYGLLAFLIIYNLFLYFSARDSIYIFYSLYLVGCALVSFSEDGLCFEFLWPDHPFFNTLIEHYCEHFFLLFFMQYATRFIELNKNFPTVYKFLMAFVVLYILFQLVYVEYTEFMYLYLFWIPFVAVYVVAIYSYLKGFKAARFLIIGYSFVLLSILMSRLRWYGIIDANIFTVYSFYFAVVLEAFVFSYAIVDRFNILKKEKEKAQETLIVQLEENKHLQTKVNRELEEKVAQRTAQLQEEKEKLNEANAKLEAMASELNKVNAKLDFDNWHLQKNLKEETKSRILFEKVSFEEFSTIFHSEFVCIKYLEEIKWQESYNCKKCLNAKYSEVKDELFSRRCTKCGYIESVTNHTIFQSLKFPLTKAFYIVYHCSLESEKLTLDELSELLQLRRNTCWSFRKKVQERMAFVKEKLKVNSVKSWESLILD